jgi:hypothetical protein
MAWHGRWPFQLSVEWFHRSASRFPFSGVRLGSGGRRVVGPAPGLSDSTAKPPVPSAPPTASPRARPPPPRPRWAPPRCPGRASPPPPEKRVDVAAKQDRDVASGQFPAPVQRRPARRRHRRASAQFLGRRDDAQFRPGKQGTIRLRQIVRADVHANNQATSMPERRQTTQPSRHQHIPRIPPGEERGKEVLQNARNRAGSMADCQTGAKPCGPGRNRNDGALPPFSWPGFDNQSHADWSISKN